MTGYRMKRDGCQYNLWGMDCNMPRLINRLAPREIEEGASSIIPKNAVAQIRNLYANFARGIPAALPWRFLGVGAT
jgi:hypothetical protein